MEGLRFDIDEIADFHRWQCADGPGVLMVFSLGSFVW